ncbi:MAG: PQQ-binding-like beta-propeller repeat protein [SAR324 cluster bacterium]|nr:PQQ-binding-like beta-propeller repeat protein [SAR324 cluster bacterium]
MQLSHRILFERGFLFWLLGHLFLVSPAIAESNHFQQRELKLLWEYSAKGAIDQAPLIRNNTVIAAPSGRALLALDLQNGKQLWNYNPQAGIWSRAFAADKQTVYFGTRKAELTAVNLINGRHRWSVKLGFQLQVRPLIHKGVVYIATTQIGPGLPMQPERKAQLLAFKAGDGTLLWSHETLYYALQTPSIYGNTLYIGGSYFDPKQDIDEGGPMAIQARSIQDGTVKWTYFGEEGFIKTIVAAKKQVAFVGYQDFVTALDTKDGNLLWRKDTGNWVPALTGNREILYYGSANTIVHAQRISNGERIWEYNIPWGSFNYILGEAVVDSERLIFLTQRGHVVGLNIETGNLLWSAETNIRARTGLALAKDTIVMGSDRGGIRAYQLPDN